MCSRYGNGKKLEQIKISRDRVERMDGSENREQLCEVLSCGHGLAVIHLNSQKLWLQTKPVQDQSSPNTSMNNLETHKVPLLTEEL